MNCNSHNSRNSHKNSHLSSESLQSDTSQRDSTQSEASTADYVDKHLQSLEKKLLKNSGLVEPPRQLSPEEQLFTEDELAHLVNPDKLKTLMSNGDDFLSYLTGKTDKFED